MAVIVVDTNILVSSPLLENREWSSLTAHAAEWGIEIVVPDVVLMETVKVVRRSWESRRKKVVELELGVFGLETAKSALLAEIDNQSAGYAEWLRARLGEMGIAIAPTPQPDHMEIARRASDGRAPYCKDKDGYRDTLIWYTVLAVAQEHPETDVWFVSDNHTDFGPKPGDWTGDGTGTRDSCPILFHKELIAELTEHGIEGRVFYVVSLNRIEQHFANQFAPIDASDLDRLVDSIAENALAKKLMEIIAGVSLDPDRAALPLEVHVAEVVGSREQADGWTFTEGTGRGDAGWTARFNVDTEVDIAALDDRLVGSEYTKELRLSGQVNVARDGQILDMTVDSAEALPGDPMRAPRNRRATRKHAFSAAQLSSTAEMLKAQQEKDNRAIREIMFGTTGIAETLRTQQEKDAKAMREALLSGTTGVADIFKAQQEKDNRVMREIMFGTTGIAEMLSAQREKDAKAMREALFSGTTGIAIADILKARREEDAKAMRLLDGTISIADIFMAQLGLDTSTTNDSGEADTDTETGGDEEPEEPSAH